MYLLAKDFCYTTLAQRRGPSSKPAANAKSRCRPVPCRLGLNHEGSVEALEGLAYRQPAEPERGRDAAFVLALDLTLEHPVEELHRAQLLAARLSLR